VARQDLLLWSINERLGGNPGQDVDYPTMDWLEDLTEMAVQDSMRDESTAFQSDTRDIPIIAPLNQ